MVVPQTQSHPRHNDPQAAFLVMLPVIRRCADVAFRDLRGQDRDDAVQETVANAYVAFVRLVARKRADRAFPAVLAGYAVKQIRDGRRVGTPQAGRDVMSSHAKRKGQYVVERWGRFDRGGWREAFLEDSRTPIPDQAAFRIDFPAWLSQLSSRNRRVARLLMAGNQTCQVARYFGVSAARVSQLRRELYEDWQRFHGECLTSAESTSSEAA